MFSNDYARNLRRPKGLKFQFRFTKNTVKHGGGNIMVYGGFSWYGVGPMHLIMDTMTILSYNYILETVKLPYTSENMSLIWSLQQDNEPKHNSKVVKNWLTDNKIRMMEWSSQSPNLNPIEKFWGVFRKRAKGSSQTNQNYGVL